LPDRREEEAGRHEDRGQRDAIAPERFLDAAHVGGVGEELAHQGQDHEHSGVRVAGPGEALLEERRA
jgi:hypothetical protein